MRLRVLACVACALLCFCSGGSDIAGGSTDTGNARVAGIITDSLGTPVAGAMVELIKSRDEGVARSTAVDSMATDADGEFWFEEVEPDTYSVVAIDSIQSLIALQTQIYLAPHSDTSVDTSRLFVGARVTGSLSFALPDSIVAHAALLGTPFRAFLDAATQFQFPLVPMGTYTVATLMRASHDMVVIATDSISVVDGTPVAMNPLQPFVLTADTGVYLLDDFDDGDLWHHNDQIWWSYDDLQASDTMPRSVVDTLVFDRWPDPDSIGYCASMAFTLDTTRSWAFVGFGATLGRNTLRYVKVFDMSNLTALRFTCRGTPHAITVNLYSALTEVYNHVFTIPVVPSAWTTFTVDIDSAAAQFSPEDAAAWERSRQFISEITFHVDAGSSGEAEGEMAFDDVELIFR